MKVTKLASRYSSALLELSYEFKHQCIFCRACLIYGALPPETRRQQAKLFNETDNEYNVLVASDAVGMGLNLNIGRIIFTSLVKNIGGKKAAISTSEIKQIAGRLLPWLQRLSSRGLKI